MGVANFDSDEACQCLAQLIDIALALKYLDISYQEGKREVKVLIDYAILATPADDRVVPKQGSVMVVDKKDET